MADKGIIFETDRYSVVLTEDALGEDGDYGRIGYAVVNKETNVQELTTTVLPQALWQATYFTNAVEDLLNPKKHEAEEATVEDVVIN